MRYLGIDNGPSGALACLAEDGAVVLCVKTPTKSEFDYQKTKPKHITRIDVPKMVGFMTLVSDGPVRVCLERPMVMPARFVQSMSAMRGHEATLIALEQACLQVQFVDSRGWQAQFLPAGCKGPDLKKASRDLGIRMWPEHIKFIEDQEDADALFIAEYARRNRL